MRIAHLWQRLSARERVLAGVAFLALFLVVVRYGVISPYFEYTTSLEEEIEQEWQRVFKMERQSARASQINESLNILRQRFQTTWQKLIPGATSSVAAANLQERVRTLASQNNLDLVTTQVMRDEALGEFRKATVQVTLRGELSAVANFLAGVEYGDWRLMVSTLEVRSTYSPRLARAGTRGPLTITLEVSGIMQGAEPPMGLTKQVKAPATARRKAPPQVNEKGTEGAAANSDETQEE
jgi:type II secretory pathway component PulM